MPASGARTTRLATWRPPGVHGSVRDRVDEPESGLPAGADGGVWMSLRTLTDGFMVRIRAVEIDSLLAPWVAQMRELVDGLELFDAHTHLGQNDPDGMRQSPDELL